MHIIYYVLIGELYMFCFMNYVFLYVYVHIYRLGKKKNYAFEGVNLQLQLQYLLSERLREQVTWSRFVNVEGLQRHNISCDLYLEHLNRFVYIYIIMM